MNCATIHKKNFSFTYETKLTNSRGYHGISWDIMGCRESMKKYLHISPKITTFAAIEITKKKYAMGVSIGFSQKYFGLNTWILANIIQLGTQSFCNRFVDFHIDPGRRLYDQMVMAARSGVANIAEGTSRHSTSVETEMRLLDVARASIDELQGDYFNFLLQRRADVWAIGNPNREYLWKINIDTLQFSTNLFHDAALHILNQKAKYDPWIENENPDIVANAMLILCSRLNRMLESQIKNKLQEFREKGGFTENMTAERIEAKRQQSMAENAPNCPICGKPMRKRMQKKGAMQGRLFWGCCDFPRCNGIVPMAET